MIYTIPILDTPSQKLSVSLGGQETDIALTMRFWKKAYCLCRDDNVCIPSDDMKNRCQLMGYKLMCIRR